MKKNKKKKKGEKKISTSFSGTREVSKKTKKGFPFSPLNFKVLKNNNINNNETQKKGKERRRI